MPAAMDRQAPLLNLVNYLKARRYRFVAVTPATHARVLARPAPAAPDLRDIFGWSRPFRLADLEPELAGLMRKAAILAEEDGMCRSTLRVASLDDALFYHSAYPTDTPDAVFLGPDTYRFARFVAERIGSLQPTWALDMGAGSGAGGISLGRVLPGCKITLVDTNPAALNLARVNAQAASMVADVVKSDTIPPGPDLVIANPPYMMDRASRAYRDGGDALLGGDLSLAWVRDGLGKLASGGTMLLYTGAAYTAGRSPLLEALRTACDEAGASLAVNELDPDVFGEELCEAPYAPVERIAAVGATIKLSA